MWVFRYDDGGYIGVSMLYLYEIVAFLKIYFHRRKNMEM